jgi:uncharacterized protein YbaR (Trm112 family)
MVHPELLVILACPEDKSAVRLASAPEIETLNARIRAGKVQNRGGHPVAEPIQEGLVRADGRWLYPVRDDIPIMLMEEAIAL